MNPKIRNYILYRKDRAGAKGGTAIYVKGNLDHSETALPPLQHLEANAVVLNTASLRPIQIVSAYQQPTKNILPTDFDAILSSPLPTLIAGDLNAKSPAWNSLEPTYFSAAEYRPDVLDIALLRGIASTHTVYAVNELSSDHIPVILELAGTQSINTSTQRSRVNWKVFTTHLEDTIGPIPATIQTTQQLDDAVLWITEKIQASIQSATTVPSRTHNESPLPQHIVELIRDRNRARRRSQQTADPADRVAKNRLCTQVHDALRELKNQAWRTVIEQADTDDKTMWRISRALKTKKRSIPALHSRNGLVYTAKDKAEAISEELEQQCSPSYQHADLDFIAAVHRHGTNKTAKQHSQKNERIRNPTERAGRTGQNKDQESTRP
ncbi:hypothetical protein CBL_05155 [Carabus blaptoides fortunei]